jgi:hypothetical protein
MNRRNFVQFNSLAGLGILSGIPAAFYSSPIKAWRFAGFEKDVIKNFNAIAAQIFESVENKSLASKIATNLLTPVEIIHNSSNGDAKDISFKNLLGGYTTYLENSDTWKIQFLNDRPEPKL